jgi:hypothetical protein
MQVRELIELLKELPDCSPVHFSNGDGSSYPTLKRVEMLGRMVVLHELPIARAERTIETFNGN